MRALGKGSIAGLIQTVLGIAWIILWACAALLAVAAVAYVGVLAAIAAGGLDASVLAPASAAEHITVAGIAFDNPGGMAWPVVLPFLLIGTVSVGGSLIIVGRLKRLFENFTSGEPFRRENADHLRVIWVTMIGIELARYLLLAITTTLIALFAPDVHGRLELAIDLSTWGSILILIVLAEVFREGARLKEEQELTI